jgi:tetratricopeptide (TPR) repeat protein
MILRKPLRPMRRFPFLAPLPGLALAGLLLAAPGIALAQGSPSDPPAAAAPAAGTPAPDAPDARDAATDGVDRGLVDALEPLMVAEFALQSGRVAEGARAYLDAARARPEPGLAERATRLALVAGDVALAREALALWQAVDPAAAGARSASAQLALQSGDRAAAADALAGLLADEAGEGWKEALQVLAAEAPEGEAAAVLRLLLERDALPGEFRAWLAFGGLAQRLGAPALADRIVDGIVGRFPGEPRAWLLQASRLRRLGDADGARAAVARALEASPGDSGLRLSAAAELDLLGDPVGAAAAIARGQQDIASWQARAAYLAKAGDRAGLAALYDEMLPGASGPDAGRRLLLAQIAETLGRDPDALAWYRGVPSGAARSQARLRIAVLLARTGRLDEARVELRALQGEDSDDGERLRDAYLLEAELMERGDRLEDAVDALDRGLAVFEEDPALLYARALLNERLDRVDAAIADLRTLVALDPDDPVALNALGYTLADRTDRAAEALEWIQRALALDPDNAATLDSYGWALFRLGRPEDALGPLREAWAAQRDAEIAAHLGEVLWVLGERDEARAIWEEGAGIEPRNRALRRALDAHGVTLPAAPAPEVPAAPDVFAPDLAPEPDLPSAPGLPSEPEA